MCYRCEDCNMLASEQINNCCKLNQRILTTKLPVIAGCEALLKISALEQVEWSKSFITFSVHSESLFEPTNVKWVRLGIGDGLQLHGSSQITDADWLKLVPLLAQGLDILAA